MSTLGTRKNRVGRGRRAWAAVVLLLVLPVCRTPGPAERPRPAAPPSAQFQPVTYVSLLHHGKGRYPDLYTPDSFAVWVDPEVAALKMRRDETEGNRPDERLKADAAAINGDFIVLECHVRSAFADMSIAYDLVGFRGVDVYLEVGDGPPIRPVQTIIGTPVREQARGALKEFGRTNLVIFPRVNVWQGTPLVPSGSRSARLVLEGHESAFYFEWPEAPLPPGATGFSWSPSESETVQAVKVGFIELYGRLRQLAHVFD